MYKNNSLGSSKIKVCSTLQPSCILTVMKPAIGYYSNTNVMGKFKRHSVSQQTREPLSIFVTNFNC